MTSVYRYLLQRTLNFTLSLFFLILTDLASFLLAVSRKSLISSILRGMLLCWLNTGAQERKQDGVCVSLTIIALETRRGTENTQYALI
uniref:Uncharacterized protein n=1 Tax=Anguilla anguilla TaxID=7936 RepID=A0A0E9X9X2_ANGAN